MGIWQTLRSVIRFRRFELDSITRRLSRAADIGDLRRIAKRRLPGGVFDYIDGAAEDELTNARNQDSFRRLWFAPRVLRNMAGVDTSTEILGKTCRYPLILAPTGFSRIADYVRPAVEPELVLRVGRALSGEDLPDAALREAITGVSAGIEIHNHLFIHGMPTSQELVASNGIHAAQVVNPDIHQIGDADLAVEGFGLWVNGRLRASAIGAEILGGGPLESLRWLVGHLTRRGRRLEAGQLVIPGSPVELVRVQVGDAVVARFTRFGSCQVTFT